MIGLVGVPPVPPLKLAALPNKPGSAGPGTRLIPALVYVPSCVAPLADELAAVSPAPLPASSKRQ